MYLCQLQHFGEKVNPSEKCETSAVTASCSDHEKVRQRLGDYMYVVMPPSVEQPFLRWWRSLSDSTDEEVRFPHDHHGNARKPLNSAKQTVREQFLSFVE